MKITAMSDLHGYLPKDIEPSDIICICGDISPLDKQRDHLQMWVWIFEEFIPWIMSLPCDEVFLVPGNHDFWFEKYGVSTEDGSTKNIINLIKLATGRKLNILLDDSAKYFYRNEAGDTIKIYYIYGSPRCKQFGNWAFMHSEAKLEDYFENIPDNVDILLTHDAPSGESKVDSHRMHYKAFNDNGQEYDDTTMVSYGSIALQEAINTKKPKYVLCGHIHDGNHELTKIGETTYANVSLLNNDYDLHYKPLTFEID